MTDTFGSGPQDHNDGTSSENPLDDAQDSSMEAPAEAPSEYEFSDSLPADDQSAPPAKRSALLPIIAAVGGIALLGGAAYWHLNGGAIPGLGGANSSFAEKSSRAVPETTVEGAISQIPAGSPPQAIPSLAAPEQAEAPALPAEVPSAATSAIPAPLPPPPPAVSPLPAPAVPVPAVASNTNSAVQALPLPPPPPVRPIPTSAKAPVIGAAPTSFGASDTDGRIEALTARVEDLQKALDIANQQLNSLQSSEEVGSTKSLDLRLSKLEQRMGTAKRKASPAPAVDATVSEEEEAAPAPVKKAVKHKAPKAHKVAAAPKSESVSSAWVLRAASNGEGWISQNAEAKELKKVRVGDTVSGIGKVTAIEAQGDSWVVRGTKGSIQ